MGTLAGNKNIFLLNFKKIKIEAKVFCVFCKKNWIYLSKL